MIMTRPFEITLSALKVGAAGGGIIIDGPMVGPYKGVVLFENQLPICLSLTKEVVMIHNGKTDTSPTKTTDTNVLQQLRWKGSYI